MCYAGGISFCSGAWVWMGKLIQLVCTQPVRSFAAPNGRAPSGSTRRPSAGPPHLARVYWRVVWTTKIPTVGYAKWSTTLASSQHSPSSVQYTVGHAGFAPSPEFSGNTLYLRVTVRVLCGNCRAGPHRGSAQRIQTTCWATLGRTMGSVFGAAIKCAPNI